MLPVHHQRTRTEESIALCWVLFHKDFLKIPNTRPIIAAALRAVGRLSGTLQRLPSLWATAVAALNENREILQVIPTEPAAVAGTPAGQAGTNEDRVVVTVSVEKGYHINANPASFDYLIPTTVRFENLKPIQVSYPEALRFKTAFASDGLDVYEGAMRLVVSFSKGALPGRAIIRGSVMAQACDEHICLPPSELPFSVPPDNR